MFIIRLKSFDWNKDKEVYGYLCDVSISCTSGAHATVTGSTSDNDVLLFASRQLALNVATFCLSSLLSCCGFDVIDRDTHSLVYSTGDFEKLRQLQGGKNENGARSLFTH